MRPCGATIHIRHADTEHRSGRPGTVRLLRPREVAAELSVSVYVVRGLIGGGQLRALAVGRRWRVRPQDLESYVARQLATSGQPEPGPPNPAPASLEARRAAQRLAASASDRASREAEIRRELAEAGGSNLLALLKSVGDPT